MRMVLLTAIMLMLIVLNIFFGAISIPIADTFAILSGRGDADEAIRYIILESRIPQSITALTAGASLAGAGLMLQTLFRNPLAGPSILGITSGSSLGVALVLLAGGGFFYLDGGALGGEMAITTAALAGSFAVIGILLVLSRRLRNNLSLLIAGMMVGYLASAMVSLLSSAASAKGVQSYVMWGMGTFSGVTSAMLPWFAVTCIAGLIIAILLTKPLNLLLLGDNYAANLGVNIKRVRFWLLVSTGILSAAVTAFCGPIGFIGLAMPHIARLIYRTDDHRLLMPATLLCGSILALGCNLLSVAPEGFVIPINALTPIAGIPVVLYVILRKNR